MHSTTASRGELLLPLWHCSTNTASKDHQAMEANWNVKRCLDAFSPKRGQVLTTFQFMYIAFTLPYRSSRAPLSSSPTLCPSDNLFPCTKASAKVLEKLFLVIVFQKMLNFLWYLLSSWHSICTLKCLMAHMTWVLILHWMTMGLPICSASSWVPLQASMHFSTHM